MGELATDRLIPVEEHHDSWTYHRSITVRRNRHSGHAELEDDFHRLGVDLDLKDGVIIGTDGYFKRAPWSTCSGATMLLEGLVGLTLSEIANRQIADRHLHCTHLLDLAESVARQTSEADHLAQRIDMTVELSNYRKVVAAELYVDGQTFLDWTIADGVIVAPEAFAGQPLSSLLGWIQVSQHRELATHVWMLRRAIHIAHGKNLLLDQLETAADLYDGWTQAIHTCHTLQPDRIHSALRNRETVRHFTSSAQLLA